MIKEKLRTQILDDSLRDFKDHLSGIYKGYYMTLIATVGNGQYIVTINAYSANDAGNAQLAAFLQNQKEVNKKISDVKVYTYCAVLTVKCPNLLKNLPATLNETIDPVINYLLNGAYVSGCNRCGSTAESIGCYEINGGYHYICDNCAGEVEVNLQEKQEAIIAQKSNLVPGLVGAILGALIGCIVWILIYKLGYIAGIAGLAIGVCSMKGYELLGKHLDKKVSLFLLL